MATLPDDRCRDRLLLICAEQLNINFRHFDQALTAASGYDVLYRTTYTNDLPVSSLKIPKASVLADGHNAHEEFAMAIKVERIVFLSLLLDLFAFTVPLPLFPRIIEWYTVVSQALRTFVVADEALNDHSANPHILMVS